MTNEDGTAGGLIEFLERAGQRGDIKLSTAKADASSVRQVLGIDGNGWEQMDVQSLDMDAQFDRFVNVKHADYTPDTLATYRSRFTKAVSLYKRYLANPTEFRFSTKGQVRVRRPTIASTASTPTASAVETATAPPSEPDQHELVKYPFPLRPGLLVVLQLPEDLTSAETRRLAVFISALAVGTAEQPADPDVQREE